MTGILTPTHLGTAPTVRGDERWTIAGPLTYATAAAVLADTRSRPLPASGVVDCRAVDAVDSAAVAVLLAWKRRAAAEGKPLALVELPATLTLLADLYGVGEMLGA